MTPESPPPPNDQPWPIAKSMFFVSLLSGPLPWIFFFINRTDPNQSAEQRRWTNRILIVAIVDLLVVCALAYLGTHYGELKHIRAEKPKSVIGVVVDDPALPEGLKVSTITPNSPAQAANIAVGDVIDRCDDKPVRSSLELRSCVGAHPPGEQIALAIHRGEVLRELKLFTKSPDELLAKQKTPLDAPLCKPLEAPPTGQLIAVALFLLLGIIVVVRGGGPSVLALALALPVISVTGHLLTQQLCLHTNLSSGVRGLVELPFSPLSLLVVAIVVDRFALRNHAPKLNSGERGWAWTGLLAIWVHVAGVVRIAILLGAILIATRSGPIESTPVEELIAEGAKSPLIKLLFFFTAAVLAPLAEERFFRGVFMEGLLRVMRPWMAVAGVALVFGLLHGGYGIRSAVVIWLACVLGWARLQSKGLKAPILLHAAQNTLVGLFFLLR